MNEAARIASEDAECLVTMVQGLGEIGPEFALEVGAPQGTYQTTVVTLQLPAYGALE